MFLGIGGMMLGSHLFPLVHLATPDRALAYRRCQTLVRLAFRLFIQVMSGLGVLTYAFEGAARLREARGALILANHPSLIDVVFIVSHLPQAVCVVKKSHWYNPFVMGIMRGAGYIPNDDPAQMVDDCVAALTRGDNLVIFPEGTHPAQSADPTEGGGWPRSLPRPASRSCLSTSAARRPPSPKGRSGTEFRSGLPLACSAP